MEAKAETKVVDLKEIIKNIDYTELYGRGGAFLITPLDQSKIFTREMFSEDQKMFAAAAEETDEKKKLQ